MPTCFRFLDALAIRYLPQRELSDFDSRAWCKDLHRYSDGKTPSVTKWGLGFFKHGADAIGATTSAQYPQFKGVDVCRHDRCVVP